MNKNNITIRLEKKEEYREVENLIRESFWNVYRPGCLEHFVLNQLRNNSDFIAELDYVMELNGKLIGQNIFMKAVIKADDGRDIPIVTMGLSASHPSLRGRDMARYCWTIVLIRLIRWDLVQYALKVTLTFMERVDSLMLANSVFVIMDFQRVKIHRSFFARS
ncbi:MAG: hypothetical protein E6179_08820 [Anaerococcus vaginalis]|nr:hypothetical protein [Anaerococcus vaginalis]MDU5253185.1 hypothetical protein [Anaerococcus vaginalis]MDU6782601.1 hypothetical protein [Anaerococcus vaginalis]